MLKGSSSSGPALRLYPRGFLGANINPQTERTPEPFSGVKSQTQYQVNDKKHGGGGPPSTLKHFMQNTSRRIQHGIHLSSVSVSYVLR